MRVLFLGGPWDGEHHEVAADELPHTVYVIPAETLAAANLFGEPGLAIEPVLYSLRPQANGAPAYVAPGWPPPPKACVVPDCTREAREVFTAAERGRLAGREWQPGDQIDLCPPHGYDVHNAQYVYGVDQLAEWLRPDARADVLDWAGLGLAAEEVAASRAHAMRVRR